MNKYEFLEKIGEGSFGKIYKGRNVRTNEHVAIKVEPIACETKMLKNETKIYQYLASGEGIPKVKWFGVDEKNNYMVMTLLGPSLTDLKKKYNRFSLKVVFQFGKQILERLKFIHFMGLIHRDITPENFLLGKDNTIFIIDFGLCRKYIKNDKHIENKKISKIIGTASYVSLNVHELNEPSRRDDLESMIYILLYLYFEKLDWERKEDLDLMENKKMKMVENLNVPDSIRKSLLYIREMRFDEKPDYDYIANLFVQEIYLLSQKAKEISSI